MLYYANNPINFNEIRDALVYGNGRVLVKKFNGSWVDNNTWESVNREDVPAVTYKDVNGVVTYYKAGDGTGD